MRYHDLFESAGANNIYAHVSPGGNLATILQNGLVPNVGGGNYAGYWESLAGVYVTDLPQVLKQHIFARSMEGHYLIVLVQVAGQTFMDEDGIDNMLQVAAEEVATKNGIDWDEVDPEEDETWREIVPIFLNKLGSPQAASAKYRSFIEEYVHDWLIEHLGGETDEMWWPTAKEKLIKICCRNAHQGSLRIPRAVGYRGSNHIVTVIEVTNGAAKIVKGAIPPTALDLVNGIIGPDYSF